MKISLITPTFNSEKYISMTVNSVVGQNYSNFEHIIVDNLSSDKTLKKIETLYRERNILEKLKVVSEKDNGIAEAFNKGIKLADGDLIGILNSDDYYYDDSVFEKVVKVFSTPGILYCHGNILFKDKLYGSNVRRPLLCRIEKGMPFNHPTMFFKKEIFENFGVYNPKYKYAMDYEFISRLYISIPGFYEKGIYIKDKPLVVMKAGGVSWENELNALKEIRKTLKSYNRWNLTAKRFFYFRKFRIKLKSYLTKIGVQFLVKAWRRAKWKN